MKTDQPPVIDGKLDDAAWKQVPAVTDFIQNFPSYGQIASQRTVVRIIYDNDAIYVGAYLYDDPALIRKQITSRDDETQKDLDYFSVFFDTYHDHQNGFQFLVTSSNVQTDARIAPNQTLGFGEYGDKTWDAVWDSKVTIANDGWIVEMKIPYISLRFAKKNVQDWGVQLLRMVRRNNETSFWNPVDPHVNGFVNQFGLLHNLTDIQPPLRLSLSPYVSTGLRSTPDNNTYRNEVLGSGGMDIKYGINESFTLDATLIPDYGQVISDNVVNNLTPYEIQFTDYRPFFTEGTDIFNKSGLFYSRRIGATPGGYQSILDTANTDPNIEILKNPARTQLYNAIKLSGRTKKKLGIGVFNAVAAPMYATYRDVTTEDKTRVRTEPFANYSIIVLDQALKDRSYITFTNTNVIRKGADRDANVTGLDFSLYDKANRYNIRGYAHYSKIFTTNSYDGYNTQIRFAKVSGNIQYYVQNIIRSDKYDPNDLGFLDINNQYIHSAAISYNQFTPTKNFLNYNYKFNVQYSRLYKPNKFKDLYTQLSGTWIFKNFWDVTFTAAYFPDQHDYFVVGAPFTKYARRPQYGALGLTGSTDSRKRLFFYYNALVSDFFKNPEKSYKILEGDIRYRFSNKLTFDLSHRYEAETDYITAYAPDALGEPRIAFVDFKDVTSILSGIYNFTPRINLTVRVRHYWSHVPVKRIAYLGNDGRPFGPETILTNVTDNVNFFNSDAFFTWDFRYGSRIIVGYKNWLGEDEAIDGNDHRKYFSNLGKSFDMRHGNEVTIRFIYFLDYNQLRRKK
ncbi:MAG: DUF5916 domain-containing protein [Chitinophagaceae bacterium]